MSKTSVVLLEQSAFRSALGSFSRTVLAWSWVICTRYTGEDETPPPLYVQGFLSVFSLAGTLYHLCVIWTCSIGHRNGNEVFIFKISPRPKGVFLNWIVSAKCVLPVTFWTVLLWLNTKVIYFRLIYDHVLALTINFFSWVNLLIDGVIVLPHTFLWTRGGQCNDDSKSQLVNC